MELTEKKKVTKGLQRIKLERDTQRQIQCVEKMASSFCYNNEAFLVGSLYIPGLNFKYVVVSLLRGVDPAPVGI